MRSTDHGIHYIGRVDTSDATVSRFAWPATGFALRFTGTSLTLELEDTPLPDRTPENDWLEVRVDGESTPLALHNGRRSYRVAAGLAAGSHVLEVAKRTEAEVGTVGLIGITLDPGARLLPAPPRAARVIEIVGDSISAGFGIDGQSAECQFSAATEDATLTYGALAARDLDAEAWIVAWTGKGVLRNEDLLNSDTLPVVYARAVPEDPTSHYVYTRHPDVVVLNIGTNDYARSAPPDAEFRAAYSAFVGELRALHPRAFLVLVVGPMLFDEGAVNYRTRVRATIAATIAERRALGDTRVAMLELWTDPADGVGCQLHPNRTTHRRMADELVRLLEASLGWTHR